MSESKKLAATSEPVKREADAASGREAPQVPAAGQPAGVVRWRRVESALRPLGADGAPVGPDVAYETVHAARAARRKLNGDAKSAKA